MLLDVELRNWLEATSHVEHGYYRTLQWIYKWDNEGPAPIITRFCQMSTLATSYREDTEVDEIPQHVHPIDAYVKQRFLYALQEYCLIKKQPAEDQQENDIESHLPDDIHTAKHVTAVSDGSLDPITGRMAFA